MLVERIARKPLNIGPVALKPGDVVSDAAEALLPAGRMKVLVDQGWLAERPVVQPVGIDRDLLARIAELEARPVLSDPMVELSEALARIGQLEEKVALLEARRGPGRPRKVEE